MYRKLLSILDTDIVVLTANQRLSQRLLSEYARSQQDKNQIVWETPSVLPLTTYVCDLWKKNPNTSRLLLNEFQELFIWQKTIRETNPAANISLKGLASLAQQSWQILHLWDIKTETLAEHAHEETEAFLSWVKIFSKTLHDQNWMTQAELPKQLKQLVLENNVTLPKAIYLLGFEELPPAMQSLFELIGKNTPVTFIEPETKPSKPQRLMLPTQESELQAMAVWAKKHYNASQSSKKNIRIGCVVPKLTQLRKEVLRIFTDVFAPENNLPGAEATSLPFNLSAGEALGDFPMIQAALWILHCREGRTSLEALSPLLRSPYLNSALHEASLAAQLDVALRDKGCFQLTRQKVSYALKQLEQEYPETTFTERWENFCNITASKTKLPPNQWALFFQKQLDAIGWPGQRRLDSLEYQLMKRFQKLLTEFSTLESVVPEQTQSEALRALSELAQRTLFQAESEEVPIHILGTLEASGLPFDALWIMGLDDESWPPRPQPNAFFPISIQREHQLPHASAARELEYTQQLQKRFCSASQKIIMSSAQQEGDKALRPSRLICHLPETKLIDMLLDPEKTLSEKLWETRKLETFYDETASPLSAEESIQGGSWILKQQAACPFRAFASIRLQAASMNEAEPGLNAAERGTLVHSTLESVWKKIKTQAHLKTQTDAALSACVAQAAKQTCESYQKSEPDKAAFLDVEQKRVTALVLEWLALEKTRPPFRVLESETQHRVQIGKLGLTLKIDRLDELEDGHQVLIDYKTGANNPIQHWLGSRLEDPQLPLYSTYAAPEAAGTLIAQVKSGNMKLTGLISDDIEEAATLPDAEFVDWNALQADWRESLTQLSDEFCNGKANVDPLEPNHTCQFCDLHSLCRIGHH